MICEICNTVIVAVQDLQGQQLYLLRERFNKISGIQYSGGVCFNCVMNSCMRHSVRFVRLIAVFVTECGS